MVGTLDADSADPDVQNQSRLHPHHQWPHMRWSGWLSGEQVWVNCSMRTLVRGQQFICYRPLRSPMRMRNCDTQCRRPRSRSPGKGCGKPQQVNCWRSAWLTGEEPTWPKQVLLESVGVLQYFSAFQICQCIPCCLIHYHVDDDSNDNNSHDEEDNNDACNHSANHPSPTSIPVITRAPRCQSWSSIIMFVTWCAPNLL